MLLLVDKRLYVVNHRRTPTVHHTSCKEMHPTVRFRRWQMQKVCVPLTSSCQIHSRLLADPCIGPRDNHRLPVQASCTLAPTSSHPSPENNQSPHCVSIQQSFFLQIWHAVVFCSLRQQKVLCNCVNLAVWMKISFNKLTYIGN